MARVCPFLLWCVACLPGWAWMEGSLGFIVVQKPLVSAQGLHSALPRQRPPAMAKIKKISEYLPANKTWISVKSLLQSQLFLLLQGQRSVARWTSSSWTQLLANSRQSSLHNVMRSGCQVVTLALSWRFGESTQGCNQEEQIKVYLKGTSPLKKYAKIYII